MSWLRKRKNPDSSQKALIEAIRDIQLGNDRLRNEFIEEYRPFILKTVSEVCKRYVSENDDEFSMGLLAFNDAIEKFNPKKGQGFVSFAKVVITNRVIDFIRTERKGFAEVTLETTSANSEYSNAEIDSSLSHYRDEIFAERITEEISLYSEKLEEFNMTFVELTKISPKHADARKNAAQVAKIIIEDSMLKDFLWAKKQLPTKQLMEQVTMSRNTLERNRKYIIAIVVLLDSDFDSLKRYLSI